MKITTFFLLITITYGCFCQQIKSETNYQIIYEVDLSNHLDDLFHVVVNTSGLKPEDSVFSFISVVPGTYEISDFGRFVQSFEAYDASGNFLKSQKISVNQWKIDSPENLSKIVYDIEDTFDSDMENKISPPGGTGIQDDFIIFNTFGVLGFFNEKQNNPVKLKIKYNSGWNIGTSLDYNGRGYYIAESFYQLADSPILIGKLSSARTAVNNIDISIFVYSPDSNFHAQNILKITNDIFISAGRFIKYTPINHYCLLMVFVDTQTYDKIGIDQTGALEHSFSSMYYYTTNEENSAEIKNVISHEFLHILTPLNLHSNTLYPFNFQRPSVSEHIWLYEGVVEWASQIMLLRSGDLNITDYLNKISKKINFSDFFDQNISLSRLSLEVFEENVNRNFSNFYYKGALTAMCLDIELLSLSKGTIGLREVFFDLIKDFGPDQPFPENELFNIIVDRTFPEIKQFIEDYVLGIKPLPIRECLNKIGFEYIAEKPSDDKRPAKGFGIRFNNADEYFAGRLEQRARDIGIKDGDKIIQMLGIELNSNTIKEIKNKLDSMQPGDSYDMTILRNGNLIKLTPILFRRMNRNVIEEIENLTEEQKYLRKQWQKNL
jgi:predicted metalloprotease with PDZ domain